jgi:hypothetical protein
MTKVDNNFEPALLSLEAVISVVHHGISYRTNSSSQSHDPFAYV